jgi:hypothetical protein
LQLREVSPYLRSVDDVAATFNQQGVADLGDIMKPGID